MAHLQVKKVLKAKSPTRVDLAGGTLDLWPLYAFIDEAPTVNVAIDIFTYAKLEIFNSPEIYFEIEDLKISKSYKNLSVCLLDTSEQTALLRSHVNYWRPSFGFKLSTKSESPIGGGLGGSSSLTISIIKVFSEAMGVKLEEQEMVYLAHNLEAKLLKTPTGTQDYFPAITGGLNVLHYGLGRITRESLSYSEDIFKRHFLLVYTGKPHHSGLNNWQVLQDAINQKESTLQTLRDLKQVALDTVEACRKKDWGALRDLFEREYEERVKLASSFSSPEITRLKKIAVDAGAWSVKICGAGGGGCVLVWCPENLKERVKSHILKADFQVLPAQPTLDKGLVEVTT